MTNRPHLLSSTLSTLMVTMLLLSWDLGPSPAPGLALAVGPAPGDDPTLPPLSAVLRRESYEMIDTLADPVSVLDPPLAARATACSCGVTKRISPIPGYSRTTSLLTQWGRSAFPTPRRAAQQATGAEWLTTR